jgi:hypothetical protein
MSSQGHYLWNMMDRVGHNVLQLAMEWQRVAVSQSEQLVNIQVLLQDTEIGCGNSCNCTMIYGDNVLTNSTLKTVKNQ